MKQTNSHLFFCAYKTLNRNFLLAVLCFTSCLSYSHATYILSNSSIYRVTAPGASSGITGAAGRIPGYGAFMAGKFNLTAGRCFTDPGRTDGSGPPSYAAGGVGSPNADLGSEQ